MRVVTVGTGGTAGWPEPGCRCASCLRAASAGSPRTPSMIVVDGRLRLGSAGTSPGQNPGEGPGQNPGEEPGQNPGEERRIDGFAVRGLADAGDRDTLGGWDITSPDGGRLLYAAAPGAVPVPPAGAAYDIVLLDLLGDPAQLGWLRRQGAVTEQTIAVAGFADHRVRSAQELDQRCELWRARAATDGMTLDGPAAGAQPDLETGCSDDRTARRAPRRALVLGGARSGKSERAELRLAAEPAVTYLATGGDGAADPEWAARIAVHQDRRPSWWQTVETTDLASALATARGAVLIDGMGSWLAAVLDECGAWARRAPGPDLGAGADRRARRRLAAG